MPAGWALRYIFLYKKEIDGKRNLMLTLWQFLEFSSEFPTHAWRGISKACSIRFLFLFGRNKIFRNYVRISKRCSIKNNSEVCSMTKLNLGNCKVLRSYLGDIIFTIFLFLLFFGEASATLRCYAMFLFVILEFRCIERFPYTLASFVFSMFLCLHTYPSLWCVPCSFLVEVIS